MSDPQRAFFEERAVGWEQRCYPPETRARLSELVDGLADRLALAEVSTLLDLGAGTGVLDLLGSRISRSAIVQGCIWRAASSVRARDDWHH
ncbi:MAG: hypothetical protein VBE63_03090 [Lamprobacter sp.]|uniref:hypothetical protein n=1 Tax=Lamprobacter sp. TaxID=3100796 RepID=UPI002B25756B|nr:hypothetical protein [Lamprobacter sp.]MEA3638912.1 hypothetical protein [Lamprobacter sp.]